MVALVVVVALLAVAGSYATFVARREGVALRALRVGLRRDLASGDHADDQQLLRALAAAATSRAAEHERDEQMRWLLLGAIERAPTFVHVAGTDGHEILRNAPGSTTGTTSGDAIFERAVREMLEQSARGLFDEREVIVAGPPQKTFTVRAAPVEHAGTRFGSVAIALDVTESRRVEQVRKDFVANISHELRTPLGALAVLAEAAAMEADPATLRRLSARMENEAHRLASMVEDVASLSRLEAAGPVEAALIDVDRLVADAVERAMPSATQRDLSIVVDPIDATLRVRGDRLQLISALNNLLENAMKYSDSGDLVRINCRSTTVTEAGQEFVEIAVIDHGIGIPARDRERIFERFYRVDRARARDTGGTGLGLAIVRHVAVNHNGEVLVESIEGEGSTFTLRLLAARRVGDGDEMRAPDNAVSDGAP